MANKTWKHCERMICKLLGLQRVGPTGTAKPDGIGDWLVVECKHRRKLPLWLTRALAQARAQGDDEHLAVAVLHEKGMRYEDCLVVLRLGDWVEWLEEG